MGMQQMPMINTLPDGAKTWEYQFETFGVKVYVPVGNPLSDIVNFGFMAPYLLIFDEENRSMEEAVAFAKTSGYAEIAAKYSTSVVFVSPTANGGWDEAPESLFADLIAESRINQYHHDGIVTPKNRFTGEWGEPVIRGAIFRTIVYGRGKAADYLAKYCLKKIEGQYLWGPGDITPAALILENLSVIPTPERRDIPVLSVNNSEAVNTALHAGCDYLEVQDALNFPADFDRFLYRHKRWVGVLAEEPVMDDLGMVEEPNVVTVHTSPDNLGDDQGTETHRIGYVAYYRKDLFENGPVPLLLAFHGGGDSSFYIAHVSGWYRIARRHGFLLVAIENHLNSTATEMMELIEELKSRYAIDPTRIYASGFSMGGCKSWDLYQEYPSVFAALAPMDATFDVGCNSYGKPSPAPINEDTPVPLFYAGGEVTPLPELPFQAERCWDRMRYVFRVNQLKTPYTVTYEDRKNWPDPIWGISGDRVEDIIDPQRGNTLRIHYFESRDGITRTAFACVGGQAHECREHTCEQAWQFMSRFTR